MNNTEAKQLQTLTNTVAQLEKVVNMLERRIKQTEQQNKKLHSAITFAQTRINSLQAAVEANKARMSK